MKDLLETIAGEFPEEFERKEENNQSVNDTTNNLIVDGALEYVELAPHLGLPAQDEDADYHTIAGLIIEELENLPEVGEGIEFYGWYFEVIEKEGQRIERVRISKIIEEE